jgi:hypothetical protein
MARGRSPVADAANGLDQVAVVAEFLPERTDVHVDVAIDDDGVLADHA